jgi:hypothetical protein
MTQAEDHNVQFSPNCIRHELPTRVFNVKGVYRFGAQPATVPNAITAGRWIEIMARDQGTAMARPSTGHTEGIFSEGIDVDTGVRKLILATASVLVIGIGGTAMSHAADLGKTAPNPSWNTPANSGSSQHPQAAANLSKDDIREAQLELRHSGLYNGSLDGVIGPQTKQALERFQKDNGLEQTATLDALTMVAMFGNIGTSEGSSMPRNAGEGTGQ